MMSRHKLKRQISQQFLSRDKFTLSQDMTFMSRLHYTIVKQIDATIDALLVQLPVNFCDMLHHVVLHLYSIIIIWQLIRTGFLAI